MIPSALLLPLLADELSLDGQLSQPLSDFLGLLMLRGNTLTSIRARLDLGSGDGHDRGLNVGNCSDDFLERFKEISRALFQSAGYADNHLDVCALIRTVTRVWRERGRLSPGLHGTPCVPSRHPPAECSTLHRKLSGAFLSCIKLKATVLDKDVFLEYFAQLQLCHHTHSLTEQELVSETYIQAIIYRIISNA